MSTISLIGTGLYSFPEAARLLGVSALRLRRWANGYSYRLAGAERHSEPVIHRELAETRAALSFADLIELKFVSLFRDHGVSMQTIRAAAESAARRFETDHPFAVKRFHTDGKRIFAALEFRSGEATGRDTEELALSQMVFDQFVRPFFRNLESDGEEITLFRPLGPGTCIVLDPARSFGKPIEERSGISSYALAQMVDGGSSIQDVAWWYDVDEAGVADAVKFERSLAKAA